MSDADFPLAALVQMTSHYDPEANLVMIDAALAEAKAGGAVMAFLPEMSLLLDKDRKRSAPHIQRESDSLYVQKLSALAKRHAIWLHSGSIPLLADEGDKRVNRTHIFDSSGTVQARYDKIHMFDVALPTGENWTESAAYAGGKDVVVVGTPLGKMGLAICFDLRFPELFRALVNQGAEIITLPAAFTVPTGEAHWHILLRARSIETACHILAAAQGGHHADGRATFGHSLAIAPWGELLADSGPAQPDRPYSVTFAAIDAGRTQKARQAVPLARSRQNRAITL